MLRLIQYHQVRGGEGATVPGPRRDRGAGLGTALPSQRYCPVPAWVLGLGRRQGEDSPLGSACKQCGHVGRPPPPS